MSADSWTSPCALGRRDFLKAGLLAAGSVLGAPACSGGGDRRRVVVVGAGLAGLAAAYELSRRSHDVLILEARARPGGRVYTVREPFADGARIEAGAAEIPGHHRLPLHYAREFGLPLDEVSTHRRREYWLRGGMVRREGDRWTWPVPLRADEEGRSVSALLWRYLGRWLTLAGGASSPGWATGRLAELDGLSFADLLRREGASDGVLDLCRVGHLSVWGDGIESYSGLFMVGELARQRGRGNAFAIGGGNDRLPHAFASRLGRRIRYEAAVIAVRRTGHGVEVSWLHRGSAGTETADHVVCAVPFSVLRAIEFSPPLSPAARSAASGLGYTPVRRSFYQVEASPGATVPDVDVATDLPFGIVRQTGRGPGARTYLLETMACGESARRAESSPARPPVEERAARLVRMLSGPRGRVVGHAECSWDDDEWSRGAYSFPRPGGYLAMQRIGDLGEERIHFAGEHASPWPGWMQGALYSGRRAARAIDPGVPDETDAPPVPDAPA